MFELAILDSRSTENAVAFGCRERGMVDNSDLMLPANDPSSYIEVPEKRGFRLVFKRFIEPRWGNRLVLFLRRRLRNGCTLSMELEAVP
jgi:hypothetical protein